jgi:hypothetical protein
MSVPSLGSQAASLANRLRTDLQDSGLSAATASKVQSEISTAIDSVKSAAGGGRPDRASVREAIEKQLAADVQSGTLTSDEADTVRKTLEEFDNRMQQQGGPAGGKPDPAELFTKLDSDGDGKLNRDEFVAGRPKGASEDQAGQMYDSLAGGNTGGLTVDQFTKGMQSMQPPAGGPPAGGPPPGGGGGGGGGEADKTEVSRTSTTKGAVTTTVITYSDGSKETKTSYGVAVDDPDTKSSTDELLDLLQQTSPSEDTKLAGYLKSLLSGGLVDIKT